MKCGGPASGAASERPLTARAGTPRNAGEQLERLTTKRHPPIAQPGHRPRRHSPTPEVGLRFQRQPRRRRPGPKTRAGLGLPPEANPVGYPASACRAKALKRPRSFRSVQDPVPGAGHPAPPGPYRVRLVRQRQWLQARHRGRQRPRHEVGGQGFIDAVYQHLALLRRWPVKGTNMARS